MFLGLTGNIGSGKSTTLKLFEFHGFKIFSTDEMVNCMFKKEHQFFDPLAESIDIFFNTNFLLSKHIDRDVLRPLLKITPNSMSFLANLVEPFIKKEIILLKNDKENIVVEVPLLFEFSIQNLFDKTILVFCDDMQRKQRITRRNPNWTEEHINFVMASQMNQEEKLKISDYVLYNNLNSHDLLLKQIIKTIDSIKYKKI